VTRATTGGRSTRRADTYLELVKRHPLRSIRTKADLDASQAVIDELLRRELDQGELTYLDALSDLVILYEREHHRVPPLTPHELLAYLLG
jgi:HTH-type transcriptional regulator / antitoxin HigA